ncbi:MAG: hypothetical protein MUP85_08820 [Candidatus Lokiarchaeota archaeon]|nr:hypothetical protein [Candidatus Lokiarchaeota archaeon]
MDEEFEEQKSRINLNKLPFYYNKNLSEIKSMTRVSPQYQEYTLKIKKIKYQLEIYLGIPEAYKILGMESPLE